MKMDNNLPVQLDQNGNPLPLDLQTTPPSSEGSVPSSQPSDPYRAQFDTIAQRLDEQSRINNILLARLESMNNAAPVPTPSTPAQPEVPVIDPQEFLNNPGILLQAQQKMIDAAVARQVAPLNQGFQLLTRGTMLENAKRAVIAQNPSAAAALQKFGNEVDLVMQGVDPTPTNVQNAIRMVIGEMALRGQFINSPSAPATPQQSSAPAVPAAIPPSAPALALVNGAANLRAPTLSELEKRIARENGMTEEQYVHYRDASPVVGDWKQKGGK